MTTFLDFSRRPSDPSHRTDPLCQACLVSTPSSVKPADSLASNLLQAATLRQFSKIDTALSSSLSWNLDQTDSSGQTLLMLLMSARQYDLVERLWDLGADVTLRSHAQESFLTLVLRQSHGPFFQRLCQSSFPDSFFLQTHSSHQTSSLSLAISTHFYEAQDYFIQHFPSMLTQVNYRGETPLHRAVLIDDPVTTQRLLSAGADPWQSDYHHRNAFYFGCVYGSQTLPILYHHDPSFVNQPLDVDAPACFESKESSCSSSFSEPVASFFPIHLASTQTSSDCLERLLQWGALPNVVSTSGSTPLVQALDLEKERHCELLIQYGADPLLYAPLFQTTPSSFCQQRLDEPLFSNLHLRMQSHIEQRQFSSLLSDSTSLPEPLPAPRL